jgi:hypothetical protein
MAPLDGLIHRLQYAKQDAERQVLRSLHSRSFWQRLHQRLVQAAANVEGPLRVMKLRPRADQPAAALQAGSPSLGGTLQELGTIVRDVNRRPDARTDEPYTSLIIDAIKLAD